VDVSVTSPGFLRASAEHATLKSTSTGIIKRVRVKENEVVLAGQLLFEVRSPVLEEKILFLEGKVAEGNKVLKDVRKLIDRVTADPSNAPLVYATGSLATPLYNQSFADYGKKKAERQTRLLKVKQDYDRNKKLYDQQVISQVEYEGFKFELDNAIGDLDLHKESNSAPGSKKEEVLKKKPPIIERNYPRHNGKRKI